MSLIALPDGNLLGGSTTDPGTGGERKAEEAELYVMDVDTRRVLWREVVFPGVQSYTDLCPGPGGVVYGIADRERFFVFDPDSRKVLRSEITAGSYGLTARQQGPRVFATTPSGSVYLLFIKGIVRRRPVRPQPHPGGRVSRARRLRRGLAERTHLLRKRLTRLQLRGMRIGKGGKGYNSGAEYRRRPVRRALPWTIGVIISCRFIWDVERCPH